MEIKDIVAVFTAFVGLLTLLWAYTKYILERGFLPPVNFHITAEKLGTQGKETILSVKIHLHNTGFSTLIAKNIRLDLRYLKDTDEIGLLGIEDSIRGSKGHDRAGRLCFPHSVIETQKIEPSMLIPKKSEKIKLNWRNGDGKKNIGGFLVQEHDTFVQAGIDQIYTFATKVPQNAICCLAWSSFQYGQELKPWQKMVVKISRVLGLIQYTLEHATVPHTAENVFWLEPDKRPEKSTK